MNILWQPSRIKKICCLLFLATVSTQVPAQKNITAAVDQIVNKAMLSGNYPGVAVAVIQKWTGAC